MAEETMLPLREELLNQKNGHSKQKSILTIAIPVVLLLIVILSAIYIKPEKGICETSDYVNEANRLLYSMNRSINPCDDFYKFACGNILKGHRRKHFYVELKQKTKANMLTLLKEDIKDTEHKTVKFVKRFFKSCMDENDIEEEGLRIVETAIETVAGWPIVDGVLHWRRGREFNWTKVTYKFKDIGYPFAIFFNVTVKKDSDDIEKYHLKIKRSNPNENNVVKNYTQMEAALFMVKVAELFGAEQRDSTVEDMISVYEFLQQLKSQYHNYEYHEKYTIEQYQKKYDKIKKVDFNWLEFLNTLTGPRVTVETNDYIYAPDPDVFSKWISLISTTEKRTVANYMIWKVIEALAPYLPQKVKTAINYKSNITREDFCFEEIQKRFLRNPLEVLNVRRLFLMEKRQKVQEAISCIRAEFLRSLEKAVWINDRDKQILRKRAKTFTLVYGLPDDHYNNKILDDMDIDLAEGNTNTILDLLAQANKNFQMVLFGQLTIPATINLMSRFGNRLGFRNSLYNFAGNELFIPKETALDLQKDIPRYIMYPIVGRFFINTLSMSVTNFASEVNLQEDQKISNETISAVSNTSECINSQLKKYNLPEWFSKVVAEDALVWDAKLSYKAYEKWVEAHGEESKLPRLDYTPRQLFWIKSTYCHVPYTKIGMGFFNGMEFYSNVTLASKMINPYFARDFNCSVGSIMNPKDRCRQLF